MRQKRPRRKSETDLWADALKKVYSKPFPPQPMYIGDIGLMSGIEPVYQMRYEGSVFSPTPKYHCGGCEQRVEMDQGDYLCPECRIQ